MPRPDSMPKPAARTDVNRKNPKTDAVRLGIPGLDKLLGDGIPPGTVLLLPGCVGSGKTVFSLQFIAEGASRFGERGLFITFEEHEDKLRAQAARFGWNFHQLESEGMIKILRVSSVTLGEILLDIGKALDAFKPQRLVIDSFTFVTLFAQARSSLLPLEKIMEQALYDEESKAQTSTGQSGWNTLVIKKVATDLVFLLQTRGITSLLTSEMPKNSDWYSRDTVSEFACDGVFMLKLTSIGGNAQRTIELVKLRNASLRCGIFNFDITDRGIVVRP